MKTQSKVITIVMATLLAIIIMLSTQISLDLQLSDFATAEEVTKTETSKSSSEAKSQKVSKTQKYIDRWYTNDKDRPLSKKLTKEQTKAICALASQFADGLITAIVNETKTGDINAEEWIDLSTSLVSSVLMCMGPYGAMAAAAVSIIKSIAKAAIGGEAESSEVAQMTDKLTQELNKISGQISDLEEEVIELSVQMDEMAESIIDAVDTIIADEFAVKTLTEFYNGNGGDFSYRQLKKLLYDKSSCYGILREEAINRTMSVDLERNYYDQLYDSLIPMMDDFQNAIVDEESFSKSIVETYYQVANCESETMEKQETIPELETLKFIDDLSDTTLRMVQALVDLYTRQLIYAADDYRQYCKVNNIQFTEDGFEKDGYYYNAISGEKCTVEHIRQKMNEISDYTDSIINRLNAEIPVLLGSNQYAYVCDKDTDCELYAIYPNENDTFYVRDCQTVYLNNYHNGEYASYFETNKNTDINDYIYLLNNQILNGDSFVVNTQYNQIEMVYMPGYSSGEPLDTDKMVSCFVATFQTVDDHVYDFYFGDGSSDNPYLIYSEEQFISINEDLSACYRLMTNLDFSKWENGIASIGYYLNQNNEPRDESFDGELDGNGYTIANMTIKSDYKEVGLFTTIEDEGKVSNLRFNKCSVQCNPSNLSESDSQFNVGLISGINRGEISMVETNGCKISLSVHNEVINRNITGYVGGISGTNYGKINHILTSQEEVSADSYHTIAAEKKENNRQFLAVGGIVGYCMESNDILLESVGVQEGKISVYAESTTNNGEQAIKPYVTVLAGGIAGSAFSKSVSKMYSDVSITKCKGEVKKEKSTKSGYTPYRNNVKEKSNRFFTQYNESKNEYYTDDSLEGITLQAIQSTVRFERDADTQEKYDIEYFGNTDIALDFLPGELWNTEEYESQLDGAKINVIYNDCNSFGTILKNNGNVDGLSKRTTAKMTTKTLNEFNELSSLFTEFMANFSLSTEEVKQWKLTSGNVDYNAYVEYFNRAKALFGGSKNSYISDVPIELSSGAIIGITKPFMIRMGNDSYNYSDYQTVIARLFGYDNVAVFNEYAQLLIEAYMKNEAGASVDTAIGQLKYDGAVYTKNGTFVLPFAFKNDYSGAVFACVFVDDSGNMSVWLSNVSEAFTAVNYFDTIPDNITAHLDIYGRCLLFEAQLIHDLEIKVDGVKCEYSILSVHNFDTCHPNNANAENTVKKDLKIIFSIKLENGETLLATRKFTLIVENNYIVSVDFPAISTYYFIGDTLNLVGEECILKMAIGEKTMYPDDTTIQNFVIDGFDTEKYTEDAKRYAIITYKGIASYVLEYVVDCAHRNITESNAVGVVSSTCRERGYTRYICPDCTQEFRWNYDKIAQCEENLITIDEKEATCCENGFTGDIVCKYCDTVFTKGKIIPALSHNYVYYSEKQHQCSRGNCRQIENHQYSVTESVRRQENGKYVLVYTYQCTECPYCKELLQEEYLVEENMSLPTVLVTDGYVQEGGGEVVVYVYLQNNPGISSVNFGIRYDSGLTLNESMIQDGPVVERSTITINNHVTYGYNFAWVHDEYYVNDGNILKLVFTVSDEAQIGEKYNISVVYDIDATSDASGGFIVKGASQKKQFITKSGTVTVVENLPGDANGDGLIDLLDVLEISKKLVHQEFSLIVDRADVNMDKVVDLEDADIILKHIVGTHGTSLKTTDFTIELNLNLPYELPNAENQNIATYEVSLYNENKNTYDKVGIGKWQVAGYTFLGWYNKIYGGDLIYDGTTKNVPITFSSNQEKQILYAHWQINSVEFCAENTTNGKTSIIKYYNGENTTKLVNNFEQVYSVSFVSDIYKTINSTVTKQWEFEPDCWETADGISYPLDSIVNIGNPDFGQLRLTLVWKNAPNIDPPQWQNKEVPKDGYWCGYGYYDVKWFFDSDRKEQFSFDATALKKKCRMSTEYTISIYSQFREIRYTIQFDGNGGSGSMPNETTHYIGNEIAISGIKFTYEHYDFNGWKLVIDGIEQETFFSDKEVIGYISGVTNGQTITFRAQWGHQPFTLVYNNTIEDYFSPSKMPNSQNNIPYSSLVTISSTGLTANGWKFLGWSDTENGEEKYYAGRTYTLAADGVKNLYAVWEVDPYTIGSALSGHRDGESIVSDTFSGGKTYTVYNTMASIPWGVCGNSIIIDWTNGEDDLSAQAARRNIDSWRQNIIDINPGGNNELYLIGKRDTLYKNVNFTLCNFSQGTSYTIHMKNFRYEATENGALRYWTDNDEYGMKLIIDKQGTCQMSIAQNDNCTAFSIIDPTIKQVEYTGNGTLSFGNLPRSDGYCWNDGTSNITEITTTNANKTCRWYDNIIIKDSNVDGNDLLNIGATERKYIYCSNGSGQYNVDFLNSNEDGAKATYDCYDWNNPPYSPDTKVEGFSYTRMISVQKKRDNQSGKINVTVIDLVTGEKQSASYNWSTSGCFAAGTLVSMADGSQKPIEEISVGDLVMTWNFYTGKVEVMPVSMYWYHGTEVTDVLNLTFSNGSVVRVVIAHGFFDMTLSKFIYLNESNVSEYIGHEFAIVSGDCYATATLLQAVVTKEEIGIYSLRSAYNDNVIVEDMITLTSEDYQGMLTYFEVTDGMVYDQNKIQADIEQYGLYTYDEWDDYLTQVEFEVLNGKYYKILLGKGIVTYDDIISLIMGIER